MKLAIAVLFAGVAFAQPQLSFGPPWFGEYSATVEMRLAGGGVAALQFTLPENSGVTMTVQIAAALKDKALLCEQGVKVRACILSGGAAIIPDGPIAIVRLTSTSAANASIDPSSLLGASPIAAPVLIAGASLATRLKSRCDVNGDGAVTELDTAAAHAQALARLLGTGNCGLADANGDGACNVLDVQMVVNAVANGVCK